MAYDKNTWQSGDVVTSAKLNNIENGIAGAYGRIEVVYDDDTGNTEVMASYNDLMSMVKNGVLPVMVEITSENDGEPTGFALYPLEGVASMGVMFMATFWSYDNPFTATSPDAHLILSE